MCGALLLNCQPWNDCAWSGSLTERFPLYSFDWESLGVLDRWLLMGSGRLWGVVTQRSSTVFSLPSPSMLFPPQPFWHPPPHKKVWDDTPYSMAKASVFLFFSNSWSLMSHCYKVKFLLNRPTSICIKFRHWQRGLWGIHKCKTKEIILRLRNE